MNAPKRPMYYQQPFKPNGYVMHQQFNN